MSRLRVSASTRWHDPRWTVVAGAVAMVFLLLAAAPIAAQPPAGPEDLPEPTARQLSDSVRRFDPAGSVRAWDPHGHVSAMERESVDGDQMVVSLDADVLFGFGSAEVPPRAAARIVELMAPVPPGATVTVEGHTDSLGSAEANLRLSRERAEAVAAIIAASRDDLILDVVGFGETRPVAPNTIGGEDNPEGRSLNRRVEIRYGR